MLIKTAFIIVILFLILLRRIIEIKRQSKNNNSNELLKTIDEIDSNKKWARSALFIIFVYSN